MNTIAMTSWTLLAQSALDRWQGAKTLPESSFGWQWLMVFGALLAVFAIAGWIVVWIRIRRGQYRLPAGASAGDAGLSAAEVDLLGSLVLESGLVRPGMHFSIRRAVQVGLSNFLQNQTFLELADKERNHIDSTLGALQAKLGMDDEPESSDVAPSMQIPVGAKLKVVRIDQLRDLPVTVRTNSEHGLAVEPAEPVEVEIGTPWIVRYFDGHRMWEFNTKVASAQANVLRLEHVSAMRAMNVRRFQRVGLDSLALVAPFPFRPASTSTKAEAPQFVEMELAEIAGPGLRVRGDLDAHVGDLLLVAVDLPTGEAFQGVAKVRRTFLSDRNVRNLGLELVGLTPSEVAELTRMTNDVEKRCRRVQPAGTKDDPYLQAV